MRTLFIWPAVVLILAGCSTFKAADATSTGEPNWKAATLTRQERSQTADQNCYYRVDDTGRRYKISNRKACLEHIEIDVNSYKFSTWGIPILLGGMKEQFQYRPVMP